MYFIIDGRNKIQHPTVKNDMIYRWLKAGKAKFISKDIVKVTKTFDQSKTVKCQFKVGIDPGYKNIGYAVFKIYKNKIQEILSGEVVTRTPQITELIQERKMYRNSRRHNHRKNILRKFGRAKFKVPVWKNRRKKEFAPTHVHLIQSHLNILNYIFNRIDIEQSEIGIEYFKFDSQKAVNSTINSWRYQKGPQFGFENVKAYVRARDRYSCQVCGEENSFQVHHIRYKSNGGTDKPDNLITLCNTCHDKIHQNLINNHLIISNNKFLKDSGVLNSCMKKLLEIVNIYNNTFTITGADTAAIRKYYDAEKSHVTDARVIALAKTDIDQFQFSKLNQEIYMKQFRRHTRNWIHRLEDRKYKDYSYYTVAWNRRTKCNQKKDSLEQFRQECGNEKVIAYPGGPKYFRANSDAKFKPGDVFKVLDNNYVTKQWASTQGTVTSIDNIKFKTKLCQKIRNNSGLVIVPAKAVL